MALDSVALPDLDPQSLRVDDAAGIREEALFFGDGPERMLGILHRPLGTPIGGVVVCSPFGAEFSRNHRREVQLARALARRSVAVQRFHYRGSGSSDGEHRDLTFDSMVEDTAAATALLSDRTGVTNLGFLGTRLTGIVAASAAARFDGAPLALWDPALNGERYLQEVFRATRVTALKSDGGDGDVAIEDPLDQIRRDGWAEVVGFEIYESFYDSVSPRRMHAELGASPRPILLVQIGRTERLRSEFGRAVSDWTARGFAVETAIVVQPETWWFAESLETASPANRMLLQRLLLESTEEWLVREIEKAAR